MQLEIAGRLRGDDPLELRPARRRARPRPARRRAGASSTISCIRWPRIRSTRVGAGQDRPVERAAQHRRICRFSSASRWLRLRPTCLGRLDDRAGSGSVCCRSAARPAASRAAPAHRRSRRCRRPPRRSAATSRRGHRSVDDCRRRSRAEQQQRRDQEEDEAARKDGGDEIAAGDHPGGFEQAHHAASPSSALRPSRAPPPRRRWRRRRRAGRGRSIDNSSMPAPPSISALSSGSMPVLRQLELPDAVARAAASAGSALPPRPVGGAGPQPHLRPQPVARLGDQPLEADLAAGDDRDPLAQPLGMGDDVGREDDRRRRPPPPRGSDARAGPG